MKNSFDRANCGFYDADLKPHGGPDPNPGKRSITLKIFIFSSLKQGLETELLNSTKS